MFQGFVGGSLGSGGRGRFGGVVDFFGRAGVLFFFGCWLKGRWCPSRFYCHKACCGALHVININFLGGDVRLVRRCRLCRRWRPLSAFACFFRLFWRFRRFRMFSALSALSAFLAFSAFSALAGLSAFSALSALGNGNLRFGFALTRLTF